MKTLAVLLCLPLLTLANFDACQDDVEFPNANMTGYRSYTYEVDNMGACTSATLTCLAEFPTNEELRQRTWLLTTNRDPTGLFYPTSFLQLYNVQCPADTFLHIVPQRIQTERDPPDASCVSNGDFVRIRHPDLSMDDIFCGNQGNITESELYNGGFGRVLSNGEATVEFCSNPNMATGIEGTSRRSLIQDPAFDGFVVRATCIDPRTAFLPGCVDYQFIKEWDESWLRLQDAPYEKPDRLDIPHKRSADADNVEKRAKTLLQKLQAREKRTDRRMKRFVSRVVYTFDAGTTVRYEEGKLTFTFNNGSDPFCPPDLINCLYSEDNFFGTRRFYGNSPFIFTGPGFLEIDTKFARLVHFVDTSDPDRVQQLLVPGGEEVMRINAIYEYIFDCWVFPYPVVNRGEGSSLPLPDSKNVDIFLAESRRGLESFGQVEATRSLGFLQEDFWPIPENPRSCFRGTLIRAAPRLGSTIPRRLLDFCSLFYYSCNPLIHIACRELLYLK